MPILRFLGTTILGGLIVILPVVLVVAGVAEAVALVLKILAPIADRLPDSLRFPRLIAGAIVLLICFGAGMLVKTAIGNLWKRALERGVLEKIPGYTLFRTLSRRLGGDGGPDMAPALVRFDDHEVIGFVMDRLPDGRCAIFIPSSPTPAVGSLLVVTGDRVRELDVPMTKAIGCFSNWGAGTGALVAPPAK